MGVLLGPIGILLAAIGAKGPGPLGGSEAIGTLRSLGELREKGLLTEQEFEAKKAALLPQVGTTPASSERGAAFYLVWGIIGLLALSLLWLLWQM